MYENLHSVARNRTEVEKPSQKWLTLNPAHVTSAPHPAHHVAEAPALAALIQTQTEQQSPDAAQGDKLLADEQQAFLEFIIANPDTAISSVYKAVGVGVWKGNQLRDELKAQGLVEELEVRTGRTRAGRPTKVVIPTFTALELLGKEPHVGRGESSTGIFNIWLKKEQRPRDLLLSVSMIWGMAGLLMFILRMRKSRLLLRLRLCQSRNVR
jgi:hypothetical protein